jgi:hypothetical protein
MFCREQFVDTNKEFDEDIERLKVEQNELEQRLNRNEKGLCEQETEVMEVL